MQINFRRTVHMTGLSVTLMKEIAFFRLRKKLLCACFATMVLRFRKRLRLSPCKATPSSTMMMLKMVIRAMIFTGGNNDGDDGFNFRNCLGLARYMGTCQRPKRQEVAKERATALQRRSRPFCSIFPTSCIHS